MASKKKKWACPFFSSIIIFLIVIFSLTPTSHLRHGGGGERRRLAPPMAILSTSLAVSAPANPSSSSVPPPSIPTPVPFSIPYDGGAGGQWSLLHQSIGISAMHMQLLHNNKVVIFDRTDFGSSNLTLPAGNCRYDDEAVLIDCTAHSVLYDVAWNTYRPLKVQTDVWCSSGAVDWDGTLVQTGGYHTGDRKIRLFRPCADDLCDWIELNQSLSIQRWYSSDQILPDGRMIVVGGRRAFSYEILPKNSLNDTVYNFSFLTETTDPNEENNLYPFVYLLPDGNLFVFANQRSVVLDYRSNRILREFPPIPGEKRSYPATGSSVMLPLRITPAVGYAHPVVEVMVCGGAKGGAYMKALEGVYEEASRTCGRIRVTDPDPNWEMEEMPTARVMPDMIVLPTGEVLILNGAEKGTAGWECAVDPVLNPVLYDPEELDRGKRFRVLNPTAIARLYHSAAILLPDGRILVGGSNPHVLYNFTGVRYPTELSLEAFSPPYAAAEVAHLRPSLMAVEGAVGGRLRYGQQFTVTFSIGPFEQLPAAGDITVVAAAPPFTTHSFGMNQRVLVLHTAGPEQVSPFTYRAAVWAAPTGNVAPPGYYMLFVVHKRVPSYGAWIRFG